jgi:hypothetical protein
MGLTWASIAVGVFLFLLAVGIPYWLTHRRLRPREHVDADTYLKAKDQAAEDVIPEQPAHSARHVSAGTQPIGQPRQDGERRPAAGGPADETAS